MSSPGVNIDPRNYRGDMSNDPITYTSDRIKNFKCKNCELPEIFQH